MFIFHFKVDFVCHTASFQQEQMYLTFTSPKYGFSIKKNNKKTVENKMSFFQFLR